MTGRAEDPEEDPEALIVRAPRLKIPATALIDGRINAQLLRLLEEKAGAGTARDASDPSAALLGSLVTEEGVRLQVRYRRLGFLLAEGLSGTRDLLLRDRLLKVARDATNLEIRGAAMLALAYEGNALDRAVFVKAALSDDPALRYGAIEAFRLWGRQAGQGIHFDLDKLERSDPVGAVDAGATAPALLWLEDPDWVVRALAIRSGRTRTDKLIDLVSSDPNPFVRAEAAAELLAR